jgi:hypothetical protein
MGQVFVSHSDRDENGKEFLGALFRSVEHQAHFYAWEGPKAPHAETLRLRVEGSDSLFVLLSPYLERDYTAAWVSFEVGLAVALGKPVWVLDRLLGTGRAEKTKVPIPGSTGYIERPGDLKELETEPYYSLVAGAGLKTPIGPDRRPIRQVSCLNDECRATFYAFWQPPYLFCPVCRTSNTYTR